MSKHTPGPWKAIKNGFYKQAVMGPEGEYLTYSAGGDRLKGDQLEANANLIAAAPDLLEALTEIHLSFGGGNVITFDDESMARVAAVIAKATA
ncbi:hypothetical protein [Pseudomonas nitroreducens]|uniref:hypothetical protein n=1 Tax=Pseudomonas nitroreducens TaxID=46680 RepID=UPI00351CEE90